MISNISKIVKEFEKMARFSSKRGQKMESATPIQVEKALGSLYNDRDTIFSIIDKYVSEGSISMDIYMAVMSNGKVTLTVKSTHPAKNKIEADLNAVLAKKMTSILINKKVFPNGKLEVPDMGEPWMKGVGY